MIETSPVPNVFVWCTYRDWSFRILDGLLDLDGWRCGLIVTTEDCRSDLTRFEARCIPVIRIDPRHDLKEGAVGYNTIAVLRPMAIFHYGWSWIVPQPLLDLCPNVTLHPGKLPKDRGGSPIQNQIRNAETWSYANIIKLVPGLDEGPIYLREKFSLEGDDADGVWWRMTAAGALLTRKFLAGIASGNLQPAPQDETLEPEVHKRVRPQAARLSPELQTARAMYDIVRAHNETDCNTYVVKAWLGTGRYRLIIDRASRSAPLLVAGGRSWNLSEKYCEDRLFDVAFRVNNGQDSAFVLGCDGIPLFLTRFYIACG